MALFYTSTSGNDSNAGTIGAPFRNIAKGLSMTFPGDTLYIRTGTYAERILQSQVHSGTSWVNAPVIAAYPGETVTLRPGSGVVIGFTYTGTVMQYVIFDGLICDAANATNFAINMDGVNWSASNIHHIRFRNMEVKNANGSGVLTGRGVNFLEFIGGSYHHNGTTLGQDHGIYLESSDCLVEGGTFYNNSGFGVHVFNGWTSIPAARNNRNIVRNNRVYDNQSGIVLGSGDANIAYNNLIYHNRFGTGGYALGVGFNATNTKVYNNTVYNNLADGIQIRAASSNTIVKNNIAYLNGANIANFAPGSTTLSNNLVTDPSFVNAGAGDFHLQSGSAAINAGVVLAEVPRDFAQGVRPVGSTYDIGAYEFGSIFPPPPPDTVPDAPSGLVVVAIASNQLSLSWVDNSTRESGHHIERSLTGTGSWVLIQDVGANITGFIDTNLPPATTQYYRIRAFNLVGPSAYTNIANATTAAAAVAVPAAPSSLTATAVSSIRIDLGWTRNATTETSVQVERAVSPFTTFALIATLGATVITYSDTGRTPATEYAYRVRNVNSVGPSAYSNTDNATTAAAEGIIPTAPSDLTVTVISYRQLDIAWVDNSSNEDGFYLERSIDGLVFVQIATLAANIVYYSDIGSAASSSPLDSFLTLTWEDTSTDEDGFKIERSQSPTSGFVQIAQVAANIQIYVDTPLQPSTTYYYRVKSTNAFGDSSYSNTSSKTTNAAAPVNVVSTVVESTTYWYRVRAFNAAGTSAYSNITNATTPAFSVANEVLFTENQLRSLIGVAPFPASETGTAEYWAHLAGLYRGPYSAVSAFMSRAPNGNVGIITLGDLYAAAGPYHYSSFEPHDGANEYHGRILANVSITKEQPNPYDGIPGRREAQIELSNLNVNPEALTISEIEVVEDPIGLYFPVRLYDLKEQLDLFRLDGKITSYQSGVATTSVTIAIDEPKVLATPLPKVRTATIFPDLDLSTFKTQDPVVILVFGPSRKVPVGLCRTDNLTYWDYGTWRKAVAGQVTAVNVYRDGALVLPSEYTIVEPVTGYECIRFTLDQFNRGQPLPIVIDFTTTEFLQNPARAIMFLINDTTYGLGQGVDIEGFNLAAIDFNAIPIRIGGSLSEQQEARVILRDLLLHGSYLERLQGGAYTLIVDMLTRHPQHEDANFQLGFGQKDWDNISNDPSATVQDESQRLAELSIESAWDPYFNGNGSYHIHTKRTRVKVGATKKLQSRFLFDGQSADRHNHYLWIRTNARDKQFPIEATSESYLLDEGHLVKTTIPTMKLDHAVMEVIRRTFAGGTSSAFQYVITPWDVAAFTYVPGTIEQDRYADILLDYRRTPPTEPTNFTANGDIRPGESLLIESVVRLSAKRSVENITHVKFIAYRHTVPPSAVPIKEIEVDITKQLSIDLVVTGELVVFPGLAYDFECFAINKNNDPDRQESSRAVITNFNGLGDTVPPAPPTHLDAKRGSLRTVFLTWVASVDAPKVREYWVERSVDSSFPPLTTVIVAKVKTTNFTDTNTPYFSTFYYRAKAVSRSDVHSMWSNLAVMTVVPAQPSDYDKNSQYRFHRAPLNQIISGVVISPHTAFSYGTGIDATKYEWQAGALGTPQATDEWDSSSYDGFGLPLGTRLFEFVASGGFQGPFNTDFWAGFWNGTEDQLNTVVRYMGS